MLGVAPDLVRADRRVPESEPAELDFQTLRTERTLVARALASLSHKETLFKAERERLENRATAINTALAIHAARRAEADPNAVTSASLPPTND